MSNCAVEPCFRPATEGDGRCLLHSTSPQKDAAEFRRVFDEQRRAGDFDFSGYVFPGDFDCSGYAFSDGREFTWRRLGPTALAPNWKEMHWRAGAGVSFRRATFGGRADFAGVLFSGCTDFAGATFAHAPIFRGATFGGAVDFRGVAFPPQSPSATFERANFVGSADFYQVTFPGWTDFSHATFARAPDFGRTSFPGGVNFHRVQFPPYTEFHDNGTFGRGSQFIGADLQHVSFRSVDLRHCRLRHARGVEKAEFNHVGWNQWPPEARWHRVAIADEVDARLAAGVDRRGGPMGVLREERERFLEASERIYRALRASYEARKDQPRVGDFYFAEMELRRLGAARGALGQRVGSVTAWYGLLSGYGERPLHALGWFLGVCLLWAVLYLLVGIGIKVPPADATLIPIGLPPASAQPVGQPVEQLPHALLHSFLVATLLGRDVYAQPLTPLGHLVQAVESVVGPLLVALMAISFRRRFERK